MAEASNTAEWIRYLNYPISTAVTSALLATLFALLTTWWVSARNAKKQAKGLLTIVAAETIFNIDRVIEVAELHYTPQKKGITDNNIGVSKTYLFAALEMTNIPQITKVIDNPDLFFAITFLKERTFHANKHFEEAAKLASDPTLVGNAGDRQASGLGFFFDKEDLGAIQKEKTTFSEVLKSADCIIESATKTCGKAQIAEFQQRWEKVKQKYDGFQKAIRNGKKTDHTD